MVTPKVKVESDINGVKGKNSWPWEYWHCYLSTRSTYTAGKTLVKNNLLTQMKKAVVMKGSRNWQKNNFTDI